METQMMYVRRPPPPEEEDEDGQMEEEEYEMKVTIEEELLREKSPVDRPTEKKLSAQLKRPIEISQRIGVQERQSKHNL